MGNGKGHGQRGSVAPRGQAWPATPTTEQTEDSVEAGHPISVRGASAFPTPQGCLGNEAEKQGHLEGGDTALYQELKF